jgi:uncharacterized SAM-binding protein YcdF (DUF218 family)
MLTLEPALRRGISSVLYAAVKALVLPPGILLLLLFAGLAVTRRRYDAGWWIGAAGAVLLTLSSIPLVGSGLLAQLEVYPPLPTGELPAGQAQAIVILSAEDDQAVEYGRSTVGPMTLVRVRYGAWLARRTGLPVMVTGGLGADPVRSIADAMAEVLTQEGGVREVWIEGKAENTWQNAQFSAALLKARGIGRVYLVTHAWHMPRAVSAFRQAGLDVVPAPTAFRGPLEDLPGSLVPSAKSIHDVYYAAHEIVGKALYDQGWLMAKLGGGASR